MKEGETMDEQEKELTRLIDEDGNEITLDSLLNRLTQPDYLSTLDRNRPYDGQLHTDLGERGRHEVNGITFRDLRDCYIRACFDASGLSLENWPKTIYELPWEEMDPIAVIQNMTCWVEKYMGIYPNVPELRYEGPVE